MTIGQWVRRKKPGAKWHLVESVVSDDAVTRCGRRMPPAATDAGDLLEVSNVMPLTRLPDQPQLCKRCQ